MKKNTLPHKIQVGPNQYFPILQKTLEADRLGYVDFATEVIALDKNQSQVEQHAILLHELFHVTAEKLIGAGVIKRHPKEEFIEEFSGCLFSILVYSGLWVGVTKKQMDAFLNQVKKRKTK